MMIGIELKTTNQGNINTNQIMVLDHVAIQYGYVKGFYIHR